MAVDAKLVERVRRALAGEPGLAERQMFGGVCFTIGGHMACGIQGRDLVVRVGPDGHAAALAERHVRPMDFTGRPMKGFVYVAPAGCADARQLGKWLRRGVRFAKSLSPKSPKRGPRRSVVTEGFAGTYLETPPATHVRKRDEIELGCLARRGMLGPPDRTSSSTEPTWIPSRSCPPR